MRTFYDILEIKPSATQEDVERAYKKLARMYHPDLNLHKNNRGFYEQAMRELNTAYNTLKDPIKKRDYDNGLRKKALKEEEAAKQAAGLSLRDIIFNPTYIISSIIGITLTGMLMVGGIYSSSVINESIKKPVIVIPPPVPNAVQEPIIQLTGSQFNHDGDDKMSRGNYRSAWESYTKAIELEPGNPLYYYNRGLVLAAMERYDEAINDYTKAFSINPAISGIRSSLSAAWYNKGIQEEYKTNFRQALINYEAALRYDPDSKKLQNNVANMAAVIKGKTDIYIELGQQQEFKGNYATAIDDYKKALNLDPGLKDELGPTIQRLEEKMKSEN